MSRVFRNIQVLRSRYGQQVIVGSIGYLPSVQVKPCPGANRIIAAVIISPVDNSACTVDNDKLIVCKLQPLNVEVVIYAIIVWCYPWGMIRSGTVSVTVASGAMHAPFVTAKIKVLAPNSSFLTSVIFSRGVAKTGFAFPLLTS